MNICVVTLAQSYEGVDRLYNAQDIGLGKALVELGNEVNVIRFEKRSSSECIERINDFLVVSHYQSKSIGKHSICISKYLPNNTDVIICFSDNQMSFRDVYNHCQKNEIRLIPYIGVLESHSANPLVRMITNKVAAYNLSLYKCMCVCAKTDGIKKRLRAKGVHEVVVTPVCLDIEKMIHSITKDKREELRRLIIPSYNDKCSLLLFVGRFVDEKKPMEAIEIFDMVYAKNPNCRMIMIGKGPLKQNVLNFINKKHLNSVVSLMENIPNVEMWKYYVSSDCSLNLNRNEIFGMSILEAMYYECPVVAYAAPGPKMIITDKKDGFLFTSITQVPDLIERSVCQGRLSEAKKTILSKYIWKKTAKTMLSLL